MLLVLYRCIGELHVLYLIIFAAGSGVRSNIQDIIRIGNAVHLSVVVLGRIGDRVQAVHHVRPHIHMVMPLKHHINVQLVEYRYQLLTALEDIILSCMVGHRVYRVVHGNDLPCRILVFRNGIFHKRLVLRRTHVVDIEHHKQGVAIAEPVVAAGVRLAVLALVRYVKMLVIGVAGGVVVAHYRGHRQPQQFIMIQISGILAFVARRVDLVAGREQERCIRGLIDRIFQCRCPAGFVAAQAAACAELRVTHEQEGKAVTGIIRCECVNRGLLFPVDYLIGIGHAAFQAGHCRLIRPVPGLVGALAGDGHASGVLRHGAFRQLALLRPVNRTLPLGICVPGDIGLGLIRAGRQRNTVLHQHLLLIQRDFSYIFQHRTAFCVHHPNIREIPADGLVGGLLFELVGSLVLAVHVVGRAAGYRGTVNRNIRTCQVILIGHGLIYAVVAATDARQIIAALQRTAQRDIAGHTGAVIGVTADKTHIIVVGSIAAARIAVFHRRGAIVVPGGDTAGLKIGFQRAHEVAVADGVIVFRHQSAIAVPAGNGTQRIALLNRAVILHAQRCAPAVVRRVGAFHIYIGQAQLPDRAVVLKDQGSGSIHAGDGQAGNGVPIAVNRAVQGRDGGKLAGQLNIRRYVESSVRMLPDQVKAIGRVDGKGLVCIRIVDDFFLRQAHHIAAAGADLGGELICARDLLDRAADLGSGVHVVIINIRIPLAFPEEGEIEGHFLFAVRAVLHSQIPVIAAAAQEGSRFANLRLLQHAGLIPHRGQVLDEVRIDLIDHVLGVLAELEIAGGHDDRIRQHMGPAGRAQLAAVGKVQRGVIRAACQQTGEGQDGILIRVALILHPADRLAGHLVGIGAREAGRLHRIVIADHDLILGSQPGEILIEADLIRRFAMDMVDLDAHNACILAALEEVACILFRIQSAVIAGGRRIFPQPDPDRVLERRAVIGNLLDRFKLLVQRIAEAVPAFDQVEFDPELGGIVAVLLVSLYRGSTAALGGPHRAAGLDPAGVAGEELLIQRIGNIGDHIAVGEIIQVVGNDCHTPRGVLFGFKRFAVFVPIFGMQHTVALGTQAHTRPVVDIGLGDADIRRLILQLKGRKRTQQAVRADCGNQGGLGGHLHVLDALIVGAVAILIECSRIRGDGETGIIAGNRVRTIRQVILDGNAVVIGAHVQGHGLVPAGHRESGLVIMVARLGVHAAGGIGFVKRGLHRLAQGCVLPHLNAVHRQAKGRALQNRHAVECYRVAELALAIYIDSGHNAAVRALHLIGFLIRDNNRRLFPAALERRASQVIIHRPDGVKIPADVRIGSLLLQFFRSLIQALHIVGSAVSDGIAIDCYIVAGQVVDKGGVVPVVAAADAGMVPVVCGGQRAAAHNHIPLIYRTRIAVAADDAAVVGLGRDVTLHIAVEHLAGVLVPGSNAAGLTPAGHVAQEIAVLDGSIVLCGNTARTMAAGDTAFHIALLDGAVVLEAQAAAAAGLCRIGAGNRDICQCQVPNGAFIFPHQRIRLKITGQAVTFDRMPCAVQRAGEFGDGWNGFALERNIFIQLIIGFRIFPTDVDGIDGHCQLVRV